MDIEKTTLTLFSSDLTNAVLGFVGIAYFARELSPSQLGMFFLFETLVAVLYMFTHFGVDSAVQKRISQGDSAGTMLTSAAVVKAGAVTILSVGIISAAGLINAYVGGKVAPLIVAALIVRSALGLLDSVLRGELRVSETGVIHVLNQLTWLILGIGLVQYRFGPLGLIYAAIGGELVAVVVSTVRMSTSPRTPTIEAIRSLYDFARYNFVPSLGTLIYNWADLLVIGFFLGQSAVSLYEVAWRLSSIAANFSAAISKTIFPQISEWDARDATDRITNRVAIATGDSQLLVVPAFFGALVLSEQVLSLAFGAEYAAAGIVLIVLIGEKILQSVNSIHKMSLAGINRPYFSTLATVAAIVTNIVLNVLLVWQFGLIGAAAATTVAVGVSTMMMAYYLFRFVEFRFPTQLFGWIVFSSLAMTLFLILVTSTYNVEQDLEVILLVGAGAVVYFSVLSLSETARERFTRYLEVLLG